MPTDVNIELYKEVLFGYLRLRLPLVAGLSGAVLVLEWLRSRLYGGRFYQPFLRNIVLAWVPLLMSLAAYLMILAAGRPALGLTWGLLAGWFVFFPNAIYLITEVHHFRDRFADKAKEPFWFINVEILAIVGVGLLLGSYSLAIIQFLLKLQVSARLSWLIVIGYVWLANVGVYIGRYIRFNSWDIVVRPLQLGKRLGRKLQPPGKLKTLLGSTTLLSGFFLLFYRLIELDLSQLYDLMLEIERLRDRL